MTEEFNEDYYERGVETGVSCYSNYRWMPEMTIPLAFHLVRNLGIRDSDTILDYGCAKGYLVRAMRLLGFQAFGCDVSAYALGHAAEDTRDFLFEAHLLRSFKDGQFDWVIAKDVLEHISHHELDNVLNVLRAACKQALVVVPLGENGRYVIRAYEADKTHVVRESIGWWVNRLETAGFAVTSATYRMPGVKENWAQFRRGNGFITIR